MNVGARVAALEVLEKNVDELIAVGHRRRSEGKHSVSAHAACATHANFAVFLAIEVEQNVAVDHALAKVVGAGHSHFFVDGEQGLDRTGNDAVVDHSSEAGSHADTIVGAESCAISAHPFAIDNGFDRVVEEVVVYAIVSHAHHVHVTLKNDARSVFATRSSRAEHSDVARSVLLIFNIVFLGKVHQEFYYLSFVLRWARDLGQLVENLPYECRF